MGNVSTPGNDFEWLSLSIYEYSGFVEGYQDVVLSEVAGKDEALGVIFGERQRIRG